ncbi:PAS domain S-box protein [Flavobacterium taihuense]|uniref:histidine kinase n=1 Tax=Flavobacterium taihuense TaxID=2857508 RepID=A0ABS6XWF2_9FLAO|nr:PAS domain S-box protein [Flavobacterium taihuense]MBW4361003.1 PAS domain S-box protein [Flavobacterium taihuense]
MSDKYNIIENKTAKDYHIPTFLNSEPIAILTIASLYVLLAQVSLLFSIELGKVSPIYPSIGLAITSVIILGRRMLFAIWIGSFTTNMITLTQNFNGNGYSFLKIFLLASLIASGTCVASSLGVSLIKKHNKEEYALKNGKNVLSFIFIGVFVTCVINALVGVSSLFMEGYIASQQIAYTWLTWFLGDAVGFIVLAPLILAWLHRNTTKLNLVYFAKLVGITALTLLLCSVVFLYSKENKYLMLTVLLITAYRFDMRFTVAVIQIIAFFSVVATSYGIGPFIRVNSNDSILVLDAFLSVSTVATLLFAGVIAERKQAHEILEKQASSLKERIKELKCLYTVSEMVKEKGISLDKIIRKSLPVIANAFQYPEITTCRISLMDSLYKMPNFRKTMWAQECYIFVNEEALGKIEVYYLEEKTFEYDGPFLLEEANLLKSVSDILGKKIESIQMMEELQKSKIILSSTIESPNDISIYSLDLNYQYLNFNRLHQTLMMQQNGVKIEKGMSILDCIEDKQEKLEFKNKFDSVLKGKNLNIITHSKNDLSYWEIKCSPISSKANGIIGLTVFSLNITDRMKAAEDLKKSEEKYRSVFENVQDVFYITEMDGTFIEISPSIKTVTGYEPSELIRVKARDFYSNITQRELFIETLIKNNRIKGFETQIIHKNGKTIDVSVDATLIFGAEGKPIRVESVLRDITERKESEEALKKSEEKYRTIFENVQDVFFQTSIANNLVQEVSPSCETLSGYTREEVIGSPVIVFFNKPQERERYIKILQQKVQVRDYELELKTKKGELRHVSVSSKLIYDTNGKPSHIDGVMRDITQRKIIEIKIANQNTKLQVQNKELEQFAYVTSHDLQEPLITLKCFTDLIQEEYKDTLDDQGKEYLNFIFQSSTRMQELVRGLLEYSRIGRESNMPKVDCNRIIKDIIADLSITIDKNNVKISITNMPYINGYPIEIRLLFQNLISNAIKFRKKEVFAEITISASEQENDWIFTIKDNGIGIEEKNYDKIFVIFKRLHNRDDYEGTGIGLAQCKKIIALHGGSIWVESQLGQGSSFKFTIPKIPIK